MNPMKMQPEDIDAGEEAGGCHPKLAALLICAVLAACGSGSSDSDPTAGEPAPAPAAPAPAPAAPAPAPVAIVPFTCAAGAITCVEVASTSSSAQASVPVTFGQPFRAGDWQHVTQGLVAKVDDVAVPLQTDEISSHRDGSARFAVLSAQLANVQPGQRKIVNLYAGAKTVSTPSVPADPAWNIEIETQLYDANGNATTTLVVQPQNQLKTQIASASGRRLAGAVASEYTVVANFKDKSSGVVHPHLTARLHTRLVDGGARIRTDVVMENTRTWTNSPGNITYSMVIKRNGTTIHAQPKFTHYHHARWHKVVWTGTSAEPQMRVRHHMPYFMASKAVWNYNLALTIPESVLAADLTTLNQKRSSQSALGPMGNAMVTTYFPMTGGRDDIGPYPRWTANYLISQDSRALQVMLANADAAASVPIHYRDEGSGQPLDLDRYPNVTVGFGASNPVLPTVVNGTTIWEADSAHQASFSYVPYLVTGDAFYLDELMFWASWNIASVNPEYRGYGQGLLHENQIRGQAWAMRALGETYRALPDTHPQKSFYSSRLTGNLDWYANQYPSNPNASSLYPLNAVPKPDELQLTGPWQDDFLGIVFAHLAENGDPKAFSTLEWMSKFNVGRFNAESQGFCVAKAPGYYFTIRNSSGQPITTWGALFQQNFPGVSCTPGMPIDGSPASSGDYAANARAMLGAAANAGVQGARTTYSSWVARTPAMDADMPKNPTWAIVPRP
jgi:hypothetical protein